MLPRPSQARVAALQYRLIGSERREAPIACQSAPQPLFSQVTASSVADIEAGLHV